MANTGKKPTSERLADDAHEPLFMAGYGSSKRTPSAANARKITIADPERPFKDARSQRRLAGRNGRFTGGCRTRNGRASLVVNLRSRTSISLNSATNSKPCRQGFQ
jgi:hypothetical protein